MKKTLSFFFAFLCSVLVVTKTSAQTIKNYEAQWKKVDEFIQKKNLPKSALEEVKKIYALAKKESQDAQLIKSLVYMVSLQQENREENEAQAIKEIEKEIAINKEPAASILKALLADLYWQYFQQHRWQLYQRTNTVDFNKEDIATWTVDDFHKKVGNLYLQSLEKETILKAAKLQPFDAIIIKGNVRHLRPTLYDLLAHKALDYLKNSERDIKKPAYAFEINQVQAFAPAADFVKYHFSTRDSLSLQHKALLIYQKLIAFHLNDAKPDALIDVDIDRIQFVYQNSVLENKEKHYLEALSILTRKYTGSPQVSQAWFLLAAHYESLAVRYNPNEDTANRFARIEARDILTRVVNDSNRFKGTEGWANSYNLLNEITKPQFSFELEKINIPGQAFRSLVKYKNVSALNFRLIRADENLKKALENYYDQKSWPQILKASSLKSWQQSLPATNDLQQHAVEIKIDALPVGEYILLASSVKQFDNSSLLGARLFYVSNISYIQQNHSVFVLHRESGQPLANAAVNFWKQEYDYTTSRQVKTKTQSYKTDKNGYFAIERKPNTRDNGYALEINYEKDHLFLDDLLYNYYYSEESEAKITKRIFFFTDRSIYRPAQTVHFKGIIINKNKKENNIVTNYKTKVFLEDVNGENIDSLEVTTNEFGSFSGKFQLPSTLLNGEFNINAEIDDDYSNNVQFSVEEYKRPKFYVDFEKIKDSYKVGDSISVVGSAKAYAGNIVNGAKVSYRIVRVSRFPYPWLFKRGWPRTEPLEVAHGEVTTDEKGKFIIRFKAIPDLNIDKKSDPVFDYEVTADVTDINGETRSGEQQISAGYKSLLLDVKLDERLPLDSLKSIFIRTENMNGEYQSSTVTVSFSRLIPEDRLIRNRYWEQPDQFVMSKEEFIKNFPHDEYKNESDFKTWEKGEKVFSQTDSTKVSSEFSVSGSGLKAGFYEVEILTTDKERNEVKDIRYVELYDSKNSKLAKPEYLWTKGSAAIEPGGKTTIEVGSSASNVFLVQQITKNAEQGRRVNTGGDIAFSFATISSEKKSFEFSPTEADRGGFGVTYFFIKDNRFYQYNDIVQVPWNNKELKIEYATFRDKTLPGSEEKWKVEISGYKGEKLAAEMLASMYDASLDQFKPHGWNKPSVWPTFSYSPGWNSHLNFSLVQSQQRWANDNNYKNFEKRYDLFAFPSRFRGGYEMARRSAAKGAVEESLVMDSAAPSLQGNAPGITVSGQAAASVRIRGNATPAGNTNALVVIDGVVASMASMEKMNQDDIVIIFNNN